MEGGQGYVPPHKLGKGALWGGKWGARGGSTGSEILPTQGYSPGRGSPRGQWEVMPRATWQVDLGSALGRTEQGLPTWKTQLQRTVYPIG